LDLFTVSLILLILSSKSPILTVTLILFALLTLDGSFVDGSFFDCGLLILSFSNMVLSVSLSVVMSDNVGSSLLSSVVISLPLPSPLPSPVVLPLSSSLLSPVSLLVAVVLITLSKSFS